MRWQVVQCEGTEQMVVCPMRARWDLVRTGCTHAHIHTNIGQREGTNTPGGLQVFLHDKDAKIPIKPK